MNEVVIFITSASEKEAKDLARVLVEEKLAACVNILSGVESLYWWKDKIESSREWMLVVKTQRKMAKKLVKRVKEIHSYEVPEVIALPIVEGNKDYLRWISDALALRKKKGDL
ncbi:divalent cation tolerance protein CutA [bacterium]|nr:divalent cation tolerance protein CutA [bacterium]NIN91597.1 divalent cation tolerance protein CutA [bacterium]NIO17961.1 divalent cation tolerance protein CutA [bacterium]NIO73729.1 divalent cation tolerance protein CutA [bacterium]